MLERELAEFGRRMGLPGLSFNGEGSLALDVERMGRLYLEKRETDGGAELLVYLTRPCPPHDTDAPARALSLCHYRHAHPFTLSAGLHRDQLIVLTRLDERESTAARIEQAVLLLAETMNTVIREV